MCGLFSIFPKAGADPMSLRILALFLGIGNINRGRHSFGVWCNGVEPFRALGALNDEHNIPGFREYVFKAWNPEAGNWFCGHTRQATHGAKTLENTHPFSVGTLTLAHNGVVTVEGYGEKEHQVDSGRIALAIVEHGWGPGLAKVSGSCALLASVGDKLHIYRHNQVLHMVEEEWGWAISSEKSTLSEAIRMAGLAISAPPKEIIADHVMGPWDGVSQHCPAKAYQAPTYPHYGGGKRYSQGRWENGNWIPGEVIEDDEFCGGAGWGRGSTRVNGFNRGTQQPLALQCRDSKKDPDQEAKDKFLTPGTTVTKCGNKTDGGAALANVENQVLPDEVISRAAREYVQRRGRDCRGQNIELGRESRVRQKVIEMAINVERHEKMLSFIVDKETQQTIKHITPLEVPEPWYMAQTEEEKDRLWSAFYAGLLLRMGVTVEDYTKALENHITIINDDADEEFASDEVATCEWCNTTRFASSMTDRNFGMRTIKVCKWCESDFKAARRDLDFRDNKGGNRDQRRKRHERRNH